MLRRLQVLSTALLTVLGACSTSDGGPMAPARTPTETSGVNASLLGLPLPILSAGVIRNTPLATDITAGATIGSAGGTITVPGTGLTLVVPRGAVSVPTAFLVTAKAGKLVAYDFEPHGTRFPVALQFQQDLRGTSADG